MKKLIFLAVMLLTGAAFNNISAQVAPPGAGDKDLRDNNVRIRSVELERIDREADKENKKNKKNKKDKSDQNSATVQNAPEPPKDIWAEVYPQIKEDYESMQNSQAAIMTAYGDGRNIDYAKINSLSTEINKNAVRLNTNLFPVPADTITPVKTEEKKETEKTGASKSLRSLLVEMDEAVAGVISSPLFQNLRTVEPAVSDKTKIDLQQVIKLSEAVKNEAAKLQK